MEDFFSLPFKSSFYIDTTLLFIASLVMIFVCIRVIVSKNIIDLIIIMSVFSIFISICYLFMDAPDVAMTETALGACLSTCVLLNVAKITGEETGKTSKNKYILSTILCLIFVVCFAWAGQDLPTFGSAETPLQTHLTKYYIENTHKEIGIPSLVAAILGSYRGFDTLGETTVILIAGLAVLVIITRRRQNNAKKI